MPFAHPRNKLHPERSLPLCHHDSCKKQGSIYHAAFCDGSTPPWEAVLVLELLTPSILLRPIADKCRTLVLASGSLAPLPSLCAELGLFPASDEAHKLGPQKAPPVPAPDVKVPKAKAKQVDPKLTGKLQVKPKPLEADHVISLDKQLRAISIGCFPDGSPLTVTYSNYNRPGELLSSNRIIAAVSAGVSHSFSSLARQAFTYSSATLLPRWLKPFQGAASWCFSLATRFYESVSRRGKSKTIGGRPRTIMVIQTPIFGTASCRARARLLWNRRLAKKTLKQPSPSLPRAFVSMERRYCWLCFEAKCPRELVSTTTMPAV